MNWATEDLDWAMDSVSVSSEWLSLFGAGTDEVDDEETVDVCWGLTEEEEMKLILSKLGCEDFNLVMISVGVSWVPFAL